MQTTCCAISIHKALWMATAPSYQQLVQEIRPQAHGGAVSEGPMNRASMEDVVVPSGGGTSLSDLFPPSPPPQPQVSVQPQASVQPQVAAQLLQEPLQAHVLPQAQVSPQHQNQLLPQRQPHLLHAQNQATPDPSSPMTIQFDEHLKASLLVLFLYLVLSSSYVRGRLEDLSPEIFQNSYLSVLAGGVLMAAVFYMIRKYMAH